MMDQGWVVASCLASGMLQIRRRLSLRYQAIPSDMRRADSRQFGSHEHPTIRGPLTPICRKAFVRRDDQR